MAVSRRNSPEISLVRELTRAHQHMQAWAEPLWREAGLGASELDLLFTLGNTEGLRMCDAASRMLTSAPNLTRVAKLMEERGLVERVRSPESDREVLVRLTAAGIAAFERLYPQMYEMWRGRCGALFSAAELKQLVALLARINQAPAAGGKS